MNEVKKHKPFWKQTGSKRGRKKIFQTPKILKDAAFEYFKSVDENPFIEEKPHASNGEITYSQTIKKRPYTIGGMCIFFRISQECWTLYRKRPEFVGVCQVIEEIIRTQKFEGAAAGFFNHAIIARDLGLKDKIETSNTHDLRVDLNPEKEMKKRGIPIPDIELEDIDE